MAKWKRWQDRYEQGDTRPLCEAIEKERNEAFDLLDRFINDCKFGLNNYAKEYDEARRLLDAHRVTQEGLPDRRIDELAHQVLRMERQLNQLWLERTNSHRPEGESRAERG